MWNNKRSSYYIGIDCGVNTGIAVYDSAKKILIEVKTVMIHRAMELVRHYHERGDIMVIVEDARQVKFKTCNFKAQGAGSVKRDAKLWEDFLTDYKIPFQMKRPNKHITKLDRETFIKYTGYTGICSQHSRDAAMLVFGM